MSSKEIIGISEIRRDYGLSREAATAYVKATGKMLPRNGQHGAKIRIQRGDFESWLNAQKGLGR